MDQILPKSQRIFLDEIKDLNYFKNPTELDLVLDDWESRGAEVEVVGYSLNGYPIRAAVFMADPDLSEDKTVLAWGYPHPDEPLGAESLVVLGEAFLDNRLELELAHLNFIIILCGDPDNASRQLWHGEAIKERFGEKRLPTAAEYFFGVWRPTHLGLEIDYGFPLTWGPFHQPEDYQGACHSLKECPNNCQFLKDCHYKDYPYGPLPESLALVNAMEKYRPNLVFSMHSNHTGGDYTFLFLKEDKKILKDLQDVVSQYNVRHLGEALDRGHRWFKEDPDLFRERDLDYRKRALERMEWYQDDATYFGNASAVNWIEANLDGTQFICPEATLVSSPDFENTNQLTKKITIRVLKTRSPDNELIEKYYYNDIYFARRKTGIKATVELGAEEDEDLGSDHAGLASRSDNFEEREIVVPRALLGVQALYRRRKIMDRIDYLWNSLNEKIDFDQYPDIKHPFQDDRAAIRVPGKFIGDQAMLIFRTREDYLNPATVAQAATFRYFWAAQTAFVVGNFNNYLDYILRNAKELNIKTEDLYIIEHHQQKLTTLQENELYLLPEEMKTINPTPAIKSILARLLILINQL